MKKELGPFLDLIHDTLLIVTIALTLTKVFGFVRDEYVWLLYAALFLFGVISYFLLRTMWQIALEETNNNSPADYDTVPFEKIRSVFNCLLLSISVSIPLYKFFVWLAYL